MTISAHENHGIPTAAAMVGGEPVMLICHG
jgi:hypothetical protein